MIGFCTSIKNRLWQFEQTLPENLKALGDHHHITVADLGSNDGLKEFIFDNFHNEMAEGKLLYFCSATDIPWSMPVAKNLAHRISPACYLFSLDADNFVCKGDLEYIYECMLLGEPSHQFSNVYKDGSHGRIGLSAKQFYELRGYFEGLFPMGAEDADLLERIGKYRKLPPPEKIAVQNNSEQRMENSIGAKNHKIDYDYMNKFNNRYARLNRRLYGSASRLGFSSFRGHLNGEPIDITGLDRPYDLLMKSKYIRLAKARGQKTSV